MTHPYPADSTAFLVQEDADFLRTRVQEEETTLQRVIADRAALQVKLASRDRVIATLERSIEQARQALGESLPSEPITPQGDRMVHSATWGETPTSAFPSNNPAGHCSGCGEPLWKGATGLTHAYGGADCFPEQEKSPVATLVDLEPVQ